MLNNQAKENNNNSAAPDKTSSAAPTISLPKGGGAIRGIGEKFAANPVTGTGSMTVPIATSPGRSSFGPQLALSYDSGAGNGPFGFGWNLSLPAITRKTDKGLPQYLDAEESDVFILSGAEDLVPVLVKSGDNWEPEVIPPRTVDSKTYRIQRYRPRIEGLFARIERWTNQDNPEDSFWRSISKDNITTWYGKDDNSRIADPANPTRVFSWLICESYDDKGNVVVYRYKAEDSTKVDLSQAHERNRTPKGRSANRYLKCIRYGNHQPYYPELAPDQAWPAPAGASATDGSNDWFFEVVFDYDEGHYAESKPDADGRVFAQAKINPPAGSYWPVRQDPFSSYRAGFEVRTYRLCQRVLMFHHFPNEAEVKANCLVRSTEFTYSHEQDKDDARNPIYTFLHKVAQSGYKRGGNDYLKRSLPPVEFEYTRPEVQEVVEEVDPESLENLPIGLDGAAYQWTDLHGEGIPGILTEQAGSWFYKRNLSPINEKRHNGTSHVEAKFAPVELVSVKPNLTLAGGAQFMDLAGDGQPDLVALDSPVPGLYEHDDDEGWQPFRSFTSRLNRDTRDPNLKFVDLDGDGHADVLITEDDALIWYPSLAEAGFGPAQRVAQALDEEKGPRLAFTDGTQSIYLADLSGDGLTDLVRIRNGEVCYWPNLGYGRFGAKVTMDDAPHFDHPDQFDHKRIRLVDIDGTGTTDIIYLQRDGVRLYFNQSGNSWSAPHVLRVFPRVDDLAAITPLDLLGNGTACLVWSSPLPGDVRRPMRYVNLMGEHKPHLLVKTVNSLGAETHVQYAPSTRFYLQDKQDGKRWITRLPFPVHVVERVETYDHISRNRFVTRYAYHHGYFDGEEREFRGFGMVEQFDTEEFAALNASGKLSEATNIDAASHVPPVLTKTWFHTGAFLDGEKISKQFEADYYRESDLSEGVTGLTEAQLQAMLLDDTILPDNLAAAEMREACRSLKGSILRVEIYSRDGSAEEDRPYSVSERNYTLKRLQPRGENKHAVFFASPREAVDFHYERKLFEIDGDKLADPRVSHQMNLAVDEFGNVLKAVAIGYGRRHDDPGPLLTTKDKNKQNRTLITYTENAYTKAIATADDYRTPLLCETRTYELLKLTPPANAPGVTNLFRFEKMLELVQSAGLVLFYEQWAVEPASPAHRLIEHVRQLYLKNDLSTPLALGSMDTLGLPYETYKLAFTPELLSTIYLRGTEDLLQDPAGILKPECGYVLSNDFRANGWFPASDPNDHWWIPSGRPVFAPDAASHFYLPVGFRDPFGNTTAVEYDEHDLLLEKTADALSNTVIAEYDYRVLQPKLVTDPNGNRAAVAFDALGMVVGTAVMGKTTETKGDSLAVFKTDLLQSEIDAFFADPKGAIAKTLLGTATTRIIYDLERFASSEQPAFAATLARETHVNDPAPAGLKIQVSFGFSDGFGREIQKKIQAEPGPLVKNGPTIDPRWVGSGWTIFNNKGKPVKQYEPFFSNTHDFEFGKQVGVSSTLFYDPVERVVATLHPNHTYEKLVFDPWQQVTYDVNDTIKVPDNPGDPPFDPKDDPDVGHYFGHLPDDEYLPTWHDLRTDDAKAQQAWPDVDAQGRPIPYNAKRRAAEKRAAEQASAHSDTPTTTHLDTLGRPFLTIAHNKVVCSDHTLDGSENKFPTRVDLDIEGNQRLVKDERKKPDGTKEQRIVMEYDYDMLGNRIHQSSMEAGERWMLNDVAGKPIRAWDSRGFIRRMTYDELRRPTGLYVIENGVERLAERTVYGEAQGDAKNHRTRVHQVFDGAGIVTSIAYDFKGNLLESRRDLLPGYKQAVNWLQNPAANDGSFTSLTTYDALNRPLTVTTPDKSVYRPTFNEANLLDKVEVNLLEEKDTAGNLVWTPFVTNINYNAKGQRALIAYGNGATTTYEYDPLTFRLTSFKTTRPLGLNGFVSQIFADPTVVQDLRYTYDPVGNITCIEDAALKAIFHNNEQVEPVCSYIYDAIYRLIEAKGREHIGQTAFDFSPLNGNQRDFPFVGLRAHPNDLQAMRNYTERYEYDEVGNFNFMRHIANSGSWTRSYEYRDDSLIEPTKKSNRLTKTTLGNGFNHTETYTYTDAQGKDVHGCMTAINNMTMVWDFEDQLQQVALGGGGTAYYVYDASGQRVRKVIETESGTRQKERIYLGGFEIYREFSGASKSLERETLHIMDDKQRIALVETKALPKPVPPAKLEQLIRYQFGNHLGSASLELDEQAQIISYEEYTPYGSTSYQAVRSQTETPRRYRYTGKERDEESGLYYHGARYYAAWLGRWTSTDPAGIADGLSLYTYVNAQPTKLIDAEGLEGKVVHLTFDDGPKRETTPIALDALDEAGVKATFFVQGNHIQGNEDILFDIAKRGHFIGNHTFNHPTFSDANKQPLIKDEQIVDEFSRTNDAIKAALAGEKKKAVESGTWDTIPKQARDYIDSVITSGVSEYRVPQFSQSPAQTKFIEQHFQKPRAANVDSKDADTIAKNKALTDKTKTATVVENIVTGIPHSNFKGVRDQSSKSVVVLQHDTLSFSVNAIPETINRLRAEGHSFEGRLPERASPRSSPFPPLFVPQTFEAWWKFVKWRLQQ